MKIKFPLFFSLLLLCFACNTNKKAPKEITDTFYGYLPCADCPGIYHELQLNEDFTYSQKKFYLESGGDTLLLKGKYTVQADSIITLKTGRSTNPTQQFLFTHGKLKFLDQKGKEINSELAEHYILETTKPEKIQSVKKTAKLFKATGTEPFWSLKIDKKKDSMYFDLMGEKEIHVAVPRPEKTKNGTSYRATLEEGSFQVDLIAETCQNDMSGELFSHSVSVTYKTAEMQTAKTYQGCGEFINPEKNKAVAEKINGKWVLQSIDEKPIEGGNFKTPTMEIKPSEGRVSGNAGCNQYSGKIKTFSENKLAFSMLISTKMACPGLEVESKFLKAITGKILTFETTDNRLILYSENTKLVFEKAG